MIALRTLVAGVHYLRVVGGQLAITAIAVHHRFPTKRPNGEEREPAKEWKEKKQEPKRIHGALDAG